MGRLEAWGAVSFCLALTLTGCQQQQDILAISYAEDQDNIPSSQNYSQKNKDFVTVDVLNSSQIVSISDCGRSFEKYVPKDWHRIYRKAYIECRAMPWGMVFIEYEGYELEPKGEEVETAPLAEGTADSGAALADERTAGGEAIVAMVAAADVAYGNSVATRRCADCHAFERGVPNKVGPVLWDAGPPLWSAVGRDIAAVEGFDYSDALASKEGAWDYAALDAFLENPREWAPGMRMAHPGIEDPEDRAALIAYMRSLSEDPAPMPGGG
jgi:cytochrome c2